jgi:hypothetical protein
MTDLLVVNEFRAYLIEQGVGRDGSDPSPTIPSVWTQPRDGALMPREGEGATVTLVASVGPPNSLESWMEEAFVDVIVRARAAGEGELIHRSIRALVVPPDDPGGRKMWMMGALLVECSEPWRPEQPLPPVEGGLTYDRVQSFRFLARVKALRGEPYVP